MRQLDYRGETDAFAAARMIYLNKTCFNGLYRVNKDGKFNVPIGKFSRAPRCDADNLRACSEVLRGDSFGGRWTVLMDADFRTLLANAVAGDFVYLDPPYGPSSKTANFTHFTREGFGEAEQVALADLVVELGKRGVHVLLSNAGTEETSALYESRGLKVEHVRARRCINSRVGGRGEVGEILVTAGPGGPRRGEQIGEEVTP